MAVAKVLRETRNGLSQEVAAKKAGMSQDRVSVANVVLEYAPELADAVLVR